MFKKLIQAWKKLPNGRWEFVAAMLGMIAVAVIVGVVWGIPASQDDPAIFSTRLTLAVGTIGAALLSTVGILNLIANHRRANTAEKQQAQELFVSSIKNLGNREEIIRIGAIHGLRQLAKDSSEAWSDRVSEILCAHIRNTTSKSDYQAQYSSEPSVEITTLMEVLTRKNSKFDTSKFNLTNTYLVGLTLYSPTLSHTKLGEANLTKTRLEGADLTGTRLAGADLTGAWLKGADFTGAMLNRAKLIGASLDRANLTEAWLLETNLTNAKLQHTNMMGAVLGETDLSHRLREVENQIDPRLYQSNIDDTWDIPTDFKEAQAEMVRQILAPILTDPDERTEEDFKLTLRKAADLTGADLFGANLRRAELTRVILNGTKLTYAELEGSYSLSEIESIANDKYTFWKDRVGTSTDISGCIFKDGKKKIDLRYVSCGKFTKGLYKAMVKDEGTDTDTCENERRYCGKHSDVREPTQEEKERLVGKENVDKCEWGNIRVLEEG